MKNDYRSTERFFFIDNSHKHLKRIDSKMIE